MTPGLNLAVRLLTRRKHHCEAVKNPLTGHVDNCSWLTLRRQEASARHEPEMRETRDGDETPGSAWSRAAWSSQRAMRSMRSLLEAVSAWPIPGTSHSSLGSRAAR